MKRVKHEKIARRKECNTEKVHHGNSATLPKYRDSQPNYNTV